MNAKEFFKKFISHGAIIYTALSVSLFLISLMLSDQTSSQFLQAKEFLYIALFSYLLSLGSTLFASGYFSASISRLLHAACYNLGFLSFLLLRQMRFAYAIILTAVFAILYTVCAVIINIICKKTKSEKRPSGDSHGNERNNSNTASKSKDKKSKAGAYESRFS